MLPDKRKMTKTFYAFIAITVVCAATTVLVLATFPVALSVYGIGFAVLWLILAGVMGWVTWKCMHLVRVIRKER